MKKFTSILTVLVAAIVISACSYDSVRYINGADPGHRPVAGSCAYCDINEKIMFDYDSAKIRADQLATLDQVSEALKNECADTVVVVKGHASKEGTDAYNMKLSQKRADAINAELVKKGVAPDQIKEVNAGGETDVFGNLLEENRRVLILSVD